MNDVSLPFILSHHEITMREKSYVRIPIRFVPVTPGEYNVDLVVQTADGQLLATTKLHGIAYAS